MDHRSFVASVRSALESSGIDLRRPIIAAVSGGADSMALLEAMRELSETGVVEVVAAHFNHGLRGADSDGDERFVVDWCSARRIRCATGRASRRADAASPDLNARASGSRGAQGRRGDKPDDPTRGRSPEAAARTARYAFLARVQADSRASAVATGHTSDDQAETVLLHLVRGSGLAGLRGMRPVTELTTEPGAPSVTVVRPLLGLRRADTEAFCRARDIIPRFDVTNEDTAVPRNRVRHLVMPQLEAINPAARETIARFAAAARDDLDLIESLADEAWASVQIKRRARRRGAQPIIVSRARLVNLPPAVQRRALMRMYENAVGGATDQQQALEQVHIDAMLQLVAGRPGTSLDLPGERRLEVSYQTLTLRTVDSGVDDKCPFPASLRATRLSIPGVADLGDGFVIRAEKISIPRLTRASRWTTYLDPDSVGRALTVRARSPGDRFKPSGMAEEKKLQDFFVDEKVPRQWRDRVPLVDAKRGIAWVVGYRVAEWAKAKGPGRTIRLTARYRHIGS